MNLPAGRSNGAELSLSPSPALVRRDKQLAELRRLASEQPETLLGVLQYWLPQDFAGPACVHTR